MAAKKIGNLLIVDDSETILRILENTAAKLGSLTPYLARSFAEASELIGMVEFDVAILDLDLPDAHKGEVVDLALGHGIASIVLTGTLDSELSKEVLSRPIADYMVKSNLEEIRNAVFMAENIVMFKDKKVLIVDDSMLSRKILRSHFLSLNFNIFTANDGKEALAILALHPDMDLITVDYEMPGMNGVELIQQIKSMMRVHTPVIIGVCGSSDERTVVQFLKSGANDVFSKPLLKEVFNLKIANIMKLLRQQKELLSSQKITDEYQKVLSNGGLVTKADPSGKITFVNEEFCTLTGYGADEIIGQPHSLFRHLQTSKSTYKELWETILAKKAWKGLLRNVCKDGSSFYAKTVVIPIIDIDEKIVEFVAIRDDVTQLVQSKDELKNAFYNDSLTGLGNRHKMLNDIKEFSHPAVVIFDIADFKNLNNSFGSKIGDFIIVESSNRLFECFDRKKYQLYHIGGDQFAVVKVIYTNGQRNEMESKIVQCLERLRSSAFNFGDQEFFISAKAGLAYDCTDISHTDMALKHAKLTGKDFVVFCDELRLSETYKTNYEWTRKIKQAITNDRFIPYFQPIVCNKTGKIFKYECLVRMIDTDGSIVAPCYFLDIAKKSGLYIAITNIMLQKCFGIFSRNELGFSINITLEDILDESMSDLIIKTMGFSKTGKRATFEIVESEGIESGEQVREFFDGIKELGATLAIDDFGTGYSNFDYLIKLHADYIKIDGSLIKKIRDDENVYAVVKTVVEFAHNNGYKTIAEFVSSKEIFEKVRELGIDYSQGYYVSEPKPTLELASACI